MNQSKTLSTNSLPIFSNKTNAHHSIKTNPIKEYYNSTSNHTITKNIKSNNNQYKIKTITSQRTPNTYPSIFITNINTNKITTTLIELSHSQGSDKTYIKISSPNNNPNPTPKDPKVSSTPKTKPLSKLSYNPPSIAKSKSISNTKNSSTPSLNNLKTPTIHKSKLNNFKIYPTLYKIKPTQNPKFKT